MIRWGGGPLALFYSGKEQSMTAYLYQTGKDRGLKGIGDRAWERLLGTLQVGPKTAETMAKSVLGDTPAGTFIELRQKVKDKRRLEVFFKEEGKKSGITDEALLDAKSPPHDKESIRRAATKSVRAKVEKNDGPKGYKSVRVETGKKNKRPDPGYIDGKDPVKVGKPKKEKKPKPAPTPTHHYPQKTGKKPQLSVVNGPSEIIRSAPAPGMEG
jgi:hypothetical protein